MKIQTPYSADIFIDAEDFYFGETLYFNVEANSMIIVSALMELERRYFMEMLKYDQGSVDHIIAKTTMIKYRQAKLAVKQIGNFVGSVDFKNLAYDIKINVSQLEMFLG